MNRATSPVRLPYILRVGIIILLGSSAWVLGAVAALWHVPQATFLLAFVLIILNGSAFCLLAWLGTHELLSRNLSWRVDNRDWRFWGLLLLSHGCGISLISVASVPDEMGPLVAMLLVNSASMAVRFSAPVAVTYHLLIAAVFAAQFSGVWAGWIFALCLIQQWVLWSFGLSIVLEVSEVKRLRILGYELRMAQAQIAESERRLERRSMRHNLHDNMGHELATLHMNLQILQKQLERTVAENTEFEQGSDEHASLSPLQPSPTLLSSPASPSLTERLSTPLREARAATKRLFAVLDSVVNGLRATSGGQGNFVDALTELIEQASTLEVTLQWEETAVVTDAQQTDALLSLIREFLTNIMKHSGGHRATITGQYRNGELQITLLDESRFCGEWSAGNGLSGAAERIAAMDGSFEVDVVDQRLLWRLRLPEVKV